jgi:hypothetical protein
VSDGSNITISSNASQSQSAQVFVYDLLGKVLNSEKGVLGNGNAIQLGVKKSTALYMVSVINLTTNEKTVKKISRF